MMTDVERQARRERMAEHVRQALAIQCEGRDLDGDDMAFFNTAVDAITAILILDSWAKRGPLQPHQVEAYMSASSWRDACLTALELHNPYREKAH
jgi:hypothetical protein